MSTTQTTVRPEWEDPKGIRARFGISKSTLYRLIEQGKVKSTSLRERGKLRGKRLVSTDSVAAFLERLATGGSDDDQAGPSPQHAAA